VADNGVASVVARERLQPRGAENLARSAESLAERVARERYEGAAGDQRSEKRFVGVGAMPKTCILPTGEVFQRPRVPTERNDPRMPALRGASETSWRRAGGHGRFAWREFLGTKVRFVLSTAA
jgi:hypothetical protein